MTVREALGALPFGVGYVAQAAIATKFPELSTKLDRPLCGLHLDFGDGDTWSMPREILDGLGAAVAGADGYPPAGAGDDAVGTPRLAG